MDQPDYPISLTPKTATAAHILKPMSSFGNTPQTKASHQSGGKVLSSTQTRGSSALSHGNQTRHSTQTFVSGMAQQGFKQGERLKRKSSLWARLSNPNFLKGPTSPGYTPMDRKKPPQ